MMEDEVKIERSAIRGPRKRRLGELVAAVLLLGGCGYLWGCGYALVGQGSNIPEDIGKVYVEPLKNTTSRAQIDQILTQAISDELVTRRRFTVVSSAEEADAVIAGTVLDFTVRPLTFDPDGLASSFEITITADMRFQRVPTQTEEEGEVIWKNSRYRFLEDYQLDEGGTYFDRENLAIEEASGPFARTLLTDLLEGF